MASRQRPRPLRSSTPIISGDQLSSTPGSGEASERGQASAILHASSATKPIEDAMSMLDEAAIPTGTFTGEQIIHEDREARIAELAYQRAAQRGFQPGHELDDWLWAERQIDASSQGRDRDAH